MPYDDAEANAISPPFLMPCEPWDTSCATGDEGSLSPLTLTSRRPPSYSELRANTDANYRRFIPAQRLQNAGIVLLLFLIIMGGAVIAFGLLQWLHASMWHALTSK